MRDDVNEEQSAAPVVEGEGCVPEIDEPAKLAHDERSRWTFWPKVIVNTAREAVSESATSPVIVAAQVLTAGRIDVVVDHEYHGC